MLERGSKTIQVTMEVIICGPSAVIASVQQTNTEEIL